MSRFFSDNKTVFIKFLPHSKSSIRLKIGGKLLFYASKMNKKIIGFVLFFSLCVAAVLINLYLPESDALTMSADMFLTVGNKVGLNADSDAIWFGIVPPGGIGTRYINIAADKSGTYIVKTRGEPLASWISISENSFVLEKGQNKNITVQASVPTDAEYGDYDGVLEIYFRKV